MNELKRAGYRKLLWQVLCDEGPSTARELQARLCGRDIMGIRPRLTELLQRGEIADTGERRGGGRRGPREKVWAIVNKETVRDNGERQEVMVEILDVRADEGEDEGEEDIRSLV